MSLAIKKVLALPAPDGEGKYPANTLYFLTTAKGLEIHLTSADGTEIKHVPTQDEIQNTSVIFSDEAPALPTPQKLWYNTVEFVLYVQFFDGSAYHWVEAAPSYPVPEFAGNGVANTMSRSDHHHDEVYAKVGVTEW